VIPFVGFLAGVVAAVFLWGDHRGLALLAIGLVVVQSIAGWKLQNETKQGRPAGVWPYIGVLTIPVNIVLILYALLD